MCSAYRTAADRVRAPSKAAPTGQSEPAPNSIGVFAGPRERADAREEGVRGYATGSGLLAPSASAPATR